MNKLIPAAILAAALAVAGCQGSGGSVHHVAATGTPRAVATASPAPSPFVSDVRAQYNVGADVSDNEIATLGQSVCASAEAGGNRQSLDNLVTTSFSVTGNGADSVVNLAIQDLCPGSEPAPTWHVLGRYSGTGQWNGPVFKVLGNNPILRVTYRFWGNTDGYGGTNFIADLVSNSNDLQIANAIAVSGSKTTRQYPDVSYGGSHHYHLEVDTTGHWTFVIRQRY